MPRMSARDYTIAYIYTVATALMARIGKHELDFSEPYIFNCPPNVEEHAYLTKILEKDGVLSFECKDYNSGATYTISESNVQDEYLNEIRDFFLDAETYQYIEDYFLGRTK